MATGTVKWFSDKKGFGFINGEEGRDIFVHFKSINMKGFKTLSEGEIVSYELDENDDSSLSAKRIERLSTSKNRQQRKDKQKIMLVDEDFYPQPNLTPNYLAKVVLPYIDAISKLQEAMDEIKNNKSPGLIINSIKKQSPIEINFKGAAEAVKYIESIVVPWRRKHLERMARIDETEKLSIIENKKAEALEKRYRAIKTREEADKLKAETEHHRAETEKLRIENEMLRVALDKERVELSLEIIDRLSPEMSDDERISFVVKMLPILGVLSESNIQIS